MLKENPPKLLYWEYEQMPIGAVESGSVWRRNSGME